VVEQGQCCDTYTALALCFWLQKLTGKRTTVASKDNSSHWFYFPFAADEEQQQQDVAAAVRPQPYVEERGDGMPRRRRNLGNRMMAQRRAQQAEEWVEGNAWCS